MFLRLRVRQWREWCSPVGTPYWVGRKSCAHTHSYKRRTLARTRSSALDRRWPCAEHRRAAPFMVNAAEICNRALNIALSHRDCWMWDETSRVMLCLPALECAVRCAQQVFQHLHSDEPAWWREVVFLPNAPRILQHSLCFQASVQKFSLRSLKLSLFDLLLSFLLITAKTILFIMIKIVFFRKVGIHNKEQLECGVWIKNLETNILYSLCGVIFF